jgi:hypothetical protein
MGELIQGDDGLPADGDVGCAVTAPIQPAASNKSGFDGAVYKGTKVVVHEATLAREAYRVFQQGATGFVSIQSVRDDAEQRANDFCKRKTGGVMESLQETTANPPFILGNFPRVEIVFDCVQNVESAAAAGDDPKYTKLVNLKKLLDDRVITQAEFDAEKAKILSPQ